MSSYDDILRRALTRTTIGLSEPHRRKRWSPTSGLGVLFSPEGDVLAADPYFIPNALMDEGEYDILADWLQGVAITSKYLFLATTNIATADTNTMAVGVTESATPGAGGYNRQQILTTDWGGTTPGSVPALVSGDYQVTAAAKTFGPNTSGSAWTLGAVGLTTASTGTAGKLLVAVASTITSIPNNSSYVYTLKQTAS